jgi:hypothetical protein
MATLDPFRPAGSFASVWPASRLRSGSQPRTQPLPTGMINKLTFAAHILGMVLWCGAATSGYAADAPAPVPATSVGRPVRRQAWERAVSRTA